MTKKNIPQKYKVQIGNISMGADSPIRIQSMTDTPTSDIDATVKQIISLANAGAELVRITVDDDAAAAMTHWWCCDECSGGHTVAMMSGSFGGGGGGGATMPGSLVVVVQRGSMSVAYVLRWRLGQGYL